MRETLYQLTLTLALPIAVGAVWIARAERADPPVLERATPYRVELADLPLPVRERLRTPGFEVPAPVARMAPEDSPQGRDRALFEEPSRPAAIDLTMETNSKQEVVAAPTPRAAEEIAAPEIALHTPPPFAPAPLSLSSRRSGMSPVSAVPVAASETAAPTKIAAATETGKAESDATARGAADPNAGKQDRLTPVQTTAPASPQQPGGRGAGAAPVTTPARAIGNSPIVTGDGGGSSPIATGDAGKPSVGTIGDAGKSSPIATIGDVGRSSSNGAAPIDIGDVGKPPTIAHQPVDPGRPEVTGTPGRTPLLPSRPIDPIQDFSPPISDLPHYEPEPVKTVTSFDPAPGISEQTPIVRLLAPRTLVLIPEPESAILLGASLAALGLLRRSQRRG